MFLEYFILLPLSVACLFMFIQNRRTSVCIEEWPSGPEKHLQFNILQSKFLKVYLLATFADWLQGPYVYQLYRHYGYDDSVISKLFLTGFLSSSVFGTVVGHLADSYGRKKLCVVFFFLYALSCLTKAYQNFWVLVAGRILGGMATSILFSVFNAWYIHEHLETLALPPEMMNVTFARATFYNGFLAIVAGLVSSAAADFMGWGPLAPFMIAIPILLSAAFLTFLLWEENCGSSPTHTNSLKQTLIKSFQAIFLPRDRRLLYLGMAQVFYESALYTFVIAWSPMLIPLEFSLGLVFSAFMLCIMLGSGIYSYLVTSGQSSPDKLLSVSMRTATAAMTVVAFLTTMQPTQVFAQVYYAAFLLFEISVGIYFPAWGYLSGCTMPEELRASITSLFRFPMNIITCLCLQWISANKLSHKKDSDPASLYHSAFIMCVALLIAACWSSQRFSHILRLTGSTTSTV